MRSRGCRATVTGSGPCGVTPLTRKPETPAGRAVRLGPGRHPLAAGAGTQVAGGFIELSPPLRDAEAALATADVLGDCDEIATLVHERYLEGLSGDIRMNYDMCVYRSALPGFEHRVGAPQHPHDHPHDHAHA